MSFCCLSPDRDESAAAFIGEVPLHLSKLSSLRSLSAFYRRISVCAFFSWNLISKTGNPLTRFPARLVSWRPQQGSNLQRALRRGLLYPFNYEDLTHIILPQVTTPFQDGNYNKSRRRSFSARDSFSVNGFLQNLHPDKESSNPGNFRPAARWHKSEPQAPVPPPSSQFHSNSPPSLFHYFLFSVYDFKHVDIGASPTL